MRASKPTGTVKKHLAVSPHEKQVILKIENEIITGMKMAHDWRTNTVVPFYKKKGSYRGLEFLENGIKEVEGLLEKELKVKIDQMQIDFMSGKRTVVAIFILKRMQKSYF